MSEFDFDLIPEHVLHDAVYEALGTQKIEKIHEGYRFRCPICGDSKKNPLMKRGYVVHNHDGWIYHCHNECGTMGFLNFLKDYHILLYKKVIFNGFRNDPKEKAKKQEVPETEHKSYKANNIYKFKEGELVSIYDKNPTAQVALEYCKTRKIREGTYSKWFVCLKDEKFFDRDTNGKLRYTEKGYPSGNEYGNRLIIPYYHLGGKWKQFDARALDKKAFLKYKNLQDVDRELYNIDFIDTNKRFFLTEGAIDSTFLRNAGGFGGTQHLKKFLEQHPELLKNAHNGVLVWDNDDAGYDEMLFSIKLGFNWFNWNTIKPSEEHKLDKDGNPRVIKDVNNFAMYSDACEMDEEGYIKPEVLERYVEHPGGGEIKIKMLYGDRKAMKRERIKLLYEQNKNKPKTTISPWEF